MLSRYPLTNGQYRAFMNAGGYQNREWWTQEGWEWLKESKVTEPLCWQDNHWNVFNQPVVGVSFWEAQACCRWAGGRLPTEEEWESAARGPEGCEYPWCGPWETGICNSGKANLGVTSPVGLFPRSRQALLGIEDLAGNCWEWCDSYYHQAQANDARALRVLRGGAFEFWITDLRASARYLRTPWYRGPDVGFRCVLSSPHQPFSPSLE